MGAGLRHDELLNDAEALTPLCDLDVEPRRGVVDLRRHALGPGREGQPESLGVGDVLWVAHPVVEDVPTTGTPMGRLSGKISLEWTAPHEACRRGHCELRDLSHLYQRPGPTSG